MTIEQLEERRQLLIASVNQNNVLLQGHVQEIEFQIAELKKAAELATAEEEAPATDSI